MCGERHQRSPLKELTECSKSSKSLFLTSVINDLKVSVEALRKRLSVKIKLQNGEAVYVTYYKFSTCSCDLFNYRAIKLVTYTVCMCLNRSCTQCPCDKYKRSNYQCNY